METKTSFIASTQGEWAIPDNTPEGVIVPLQMDVKVVIESIKVHVVIEHPFIGDLRVNLNAPSGKSVTLHNRGGSSNDNIEKTFEGDVLNTFIGEEINGEWQLQAIDFAPRDNGFIKSWSLEANCVLVHTHAPQTTHETEKLEGITAETIEMPVIAETVAETTEAITEDISVEAIAVETTEATTEDISVEAIAAETTEATTEDISVEAIAAETTEATTEDIPVEAIAAETTEATTEDISVEAIAAETTEATTEDISVEAIAETTENPIVVEMVAEDVVASTESITVEATNETDEVTEETDETIEETDEAIEETITPDDLKKIEGIGPKIEELLNNAGIFTFAQLADTETDDIQDILDAAGSAFNRHDPQTWAEQAEMAANDEWEELKAWQDELVGGKVVED
jgi:subtilisin-like proprotein convertase family protein/predicted flap endonuclease-1-like 5' DNA nuclease